MADLPAGYLSAGQRRRLSIARLLAVQRPIWLLDEPTSTLDAAAQQRLAGFMGRHRADGGLILTASHAPIGLEASQELRVDRTVPAALAGQDSASAEAVGLASLAADPSAPAGAERGRP